MGKCLTHFCVFGLIENVGQIKTISISLVKYPSSIKHVHLYKRLENCVLSLKQVFVKKL